MILANFVKFYQREVILLKLKFVSIVRILLLILMVFSTLFVALVPAAALPPSFDSGYYYSPFHMSLRGIISDGMGGESVAFQLPLPSIGYDFTGERFFSGSSDNGNGYSVTYEGNGFSPSSTDSSIPVMTFIFMTHAYHNYNSAYFDRDIGFMLEGGFLSSDYELISSGDSIAFAVFDPVLGNSILPGYMRGEFYVGGDPYQRYTSRTENGAFLSYFDVIYHSDYPF